MQETEVQPLKILSDIVIFNKFAKYRPDLGRRENWLELNERNMNMHIKKFPQLEEEIKNVYQNFVIAKKILPSMRSYQFAGKPIELANNRLFNCAYVACDDYRVFSEIMFLLLGGSGIGFSVQKHHIEKLPAIRKPIKKRRFLVADSIEGWADAVKALISAYLIGKPDPIFDFSDIREKGAPLVTSGGKAPGAEPLKDCIHNIRKILERKKDGEQLTDLEIHDMICFEADAVLAGGIRRAALISLFDMDSEDMLSCKSGNWWELNPQRGRANNSAMALRSRITKEDFDGLWKKIEASRCGEPGINLTNSLDIGVNPCFPCDTKIVVKNEYGLDSLKTLKELFENDSVIDVFCLDDNKKVVVRKMHNVRITGIKQKVYSISFTNGQKINATLNHEFRLHDFTWKKLEDLKKDDKIFATEFNLLNFDNINIYYLTINKIEFHSEQDVYCGTVDEFHNFFVKDNSLPFEFCGVNVKNCCEISLRNASFCNLVELNASTIESQEDLNERCIAGAFLGTLQASYTNFHYLRDIWKRTTEKEALLGVSMTGIASNAYLKCNLKEAVKFLKKENIRVAKLIDINPAARLTANKPSGTTSIVLGTSSGVHAWFDHYYIRRMKLGKNEAIYKYLIKVIPELIEDDFFKPHLDAFVKIPVKAPDDAIVSGEETAIQFLERVKYFHENWIRPGHVKGDNTHNVSATVYIKDHEWEEVGRWMWENRDYYNGLSVLPYDGGTYKQAPHESITKEQYEDMLQYVKKIDLTEVEEWEDHTNLSGEIACSGGSCEIM